MNRKWYLVLLVLVIPTANCLAGPADKDKKPEETQLSNWVCVTKEAAFSPRDSARGCLFDGKMWLSNGYYHGNKLSRDLWSSTDGQTWELVNDSTPYDGYSETVAYNSKMWAIKSSVWNSTDGINWTQVLEKTPFGVSGKLVVHDGKIWQLGNSREVWYTTDGVNWTCATANAPYGRRIACAVTVFKGKLWLMGGRINKPNVPLEEGYEKVTTFNDVWCSADGANWQCVLKHAPWAPRMWFMGADYAGRMWIISGYDNVHHKNLGDVWYTEDGTSWHQFTSDKKMFSTRHEPTVYVYDKSLWVVAGNHWPVQNDVWRLTLPEVSAIKSQID